MSTSAPTAELLVEDRRGVRCLTINRPARANAISVELALQLLDAIADAAADPEVRVIMFTGAGERAFCAGADLHEMSTEDTMAESFQPTLPQLYTTVLTLKKPTLAALNGAAVGGGLELALACDIRIAAAGIKVGLPEIRYGMGPTFGTVMLTRVLLTSIAFQLIFTGDLVAIEAMERWGAVEIVPRSKLRSGAWAKAERIAAAAPLAVQKMKAIVVQGTHLPPSEAMRLQIGPDLYASEDRKEGLRAWRERRAPVWTGR